MRSLTDGAGMFGHGQRERVEAALERMSRRFPQLFVAVYTGSLGEVANIRQFGKMTYMCCGDFVDTCSAITEKNGVYCLEKY